MGLSGFWVIATLLCAGPATPEEDRCKTCHLERTERPLHKKLVSQHPPGAAGGLTCTTCHQGMGAARTASIAHSPGPASELLRGARARASCSACHLPGAVPGTEILVEGAEVYLELGCPFCHQARGFGNAAAFAPPLDGIAAKGSAYLQQTVVRPSVVFPGTKMPSFATFFAKEPRRAEALMVFLLAQQGHLPPANPHFSAPCVSCHQGEPGAKAPVSDRLKRHRCALINREKKGLACARCHKSLPAGPAECFYIEVRRRDCGVCHGGRNGS